MRIRFRVVKDIAVPIADIGMRVLAHLPFAFAKMAGWALGLLLKSAYFLPASHLRKVSKDMAVLAGRDDPAHLYLRTADNLVPVADSTADNCDGRSWKSMAGASSASRRGSASSSRAFSMRRRYDQRGRCDAAT